MLSKINLKNIFPILEECYEHREYVFSLYDLYTMDLWSFFLLKKKFRYKKFKYTTTYDNLKLRKSCHLLIRIFTFFRQYNFNFKILYYLLDNKFSYMWSMLFLTVNKYFYFYFLLRLINEYNKLFKFYSSSKLIINPNNFLNEFTGIHTSNSIISYKTITANLFLLQNERLMKITPLKKEKLSEFFYSRKFQNLWLENNGFDYSLNIFTVHFLRNQRRYNKRRYSKVRVFSRPSFFSGISLGSLFIACFWGGTIKSVDWLTTIPVIINMNFVIFILFFIIFIRFLFINFSVVSLRNFGRIRIYRFLKLFLSNSIIQQFFKK